VSTVPAVKAALVSLFTSAMSDVQVIYGSREDVTETKSKVIAVGPATGATGTAALNMRKSEDYVIQVAVSATLATPNTQQQATEAADALWVAAEAVIRNPPGGSLSVPGVQSVQSTGDFELVEGLDGDGHVSTIRFGVRVQAQ
jgi:hypothetical protein